MKKILVSFATQEEFVSVDWKDFQVGYLRTGIGKTKSVYHLTEAINQIVPDFVINIGTAGTLNHHVGDIFVCRHFIDRDMQKLKDYGVDYEIDFSNEVLHTLPIPDDHYGICNTGDAFLTNREEFIGDVIDMEAYAQAFVCSKKKIPFISVKYITDVIGSNSVEIWQEKLAEAVKTLHTFLNQ